MDGRLLSTLSFDEDVGRNEPNSVCAADRFNRAVSQRKQQSKSRDIADENDMNNKV